METALLVAVIGAAVGLVLNLLNQRQNALERRRRACADALADALRWLELPYRIRRRTDDNLETLGALAGRIHDLQERHEFHASWLRIEVPRAHESYAALIAGVRANAKDSMRDAWELPPIDKAADMNLMAAFPRLPGVDDLTVSFSDTVKAELALWKFWQ